MSRARVARRIAAAAAYGGGGLGLVGAGLAGLLVTEAKIARRRLTVLDGDPPSADGTYGSAFAGEDGTSPLVFAVLGDSTAAGFGVDHAKDTPGALLAAGIASLAECPVRLVNVAVNGARSDDLERQVTELLAACRPEVCLLMVGANDVTHRARPSESVRMLGEAVRRLRAAGAEVVVGTCPDLGTIEPVRPPLRWLARRASRRLAAAQTITVVEAGGRTVSLGDLLGPEFAGRPEMFAVDRYHPSARGYATAAMAVLPVLGAALGLWPESLETGGEALRSGELLGVLPVAEAAVQAAEHGGTEVAAAAVAGSDSGPRGRWALLLRRPLPPLTPSGLRLRLGAGSHRASDDVAATWE